MHWTHKTTIGFIATIGWLAGVPAPVFGQSSPVEKAEAQFKDVVRTAEPGTAQEPGEPDPGIDTDDRTPIGIDVAAIRLIPHQDDADPDPGAPAGDPVSIDPAVLAPEGLRDMLEGYLKQPVSMGLLKEIGGNIILAYRDTDFPLVDVYYPEQNITQGYLQIVVREGLFSVARVEGAKHSNPDYLLGQLRIESGDRIARKEILKDLDWLNENPVRTVNLIFEPGEERGTVDVVLEAVELKPFTAYAGIGNTGLDLTGENEWTAGFTWFNPLKTEHLVAYNFGSDLEFDALRAHSLFYRAPLPWRDTLQFIGAYVESDASQTSGGVPFDVSGESSQLSLEYRKNLPRFHRKWQHTLVGAFDYKSTNTDIGFGGTSVFDTTAEVAQFRLDYEATVTDDWGVTELTLSSVYSPGEVFSNNDDENFSALREGASADYWYGALELDRYFKLPYDFVLHLGGLGQITDSRLLSTEQLLAGGYSTVRGFDENIARADSGLILSTELISPHISLLDGFFPNQENDLHLLAFYEGAFLNISDALPGEPDPSLQSVGLGFTLGLGEYLRARLAYGWNIADYGLPESVGDGKLHFGVTLIY